MVVVGARVASLTLFYDCAQPGLYPFCRRRRMTATISKRSQARNERAIQELIRTVPGNDRCADCQARNPGMSLRCPGHKDLADKSFAFRVGQLERKSVPLHARDGLGSYRMSCLRTRL